MCLERLKNVHTNMHERRYFHGWRSTTTLRLIPDGVREPAFTWEINVKISITPANDPAFSPVVTAPCHVDVVHAAIDSGDPRTLRRGRTSAT